MTDYQPPRHILIRKRTDAVTDMQAIALEKALARQLADCAHFYSLPAPGVSYVTEDTHLPTEEAVAIDLVDDDGEAGAIAHHGWMPGANFGWALVGCKETPDWTVAASHEALEYFLNLRLDRWAEAPNKARWAYEIADPVEADGYPMAIDVHGHVLIVKLSDYVMPGFWGDGRGPYDYLDRLTAPFSLAPGGYAVVERDGLYKGLGGGARHGSSATARVTSRAARLLAGHSRPGS